MRKGNGRVQEPDYKALRTAMIDCQLKTTGVSDAAVLAAFAATPRELFVPAPSRALAYADKQVPLVPGRAMTEPMLLGIILTHLRLRPEDHVLVVGAATGYAAALVAALATSVVALEEDGGMAAAARANLAELGGDAARVRVVENPLAAGWPGLAPYDAMVFDGMIAEIPPALLAQLRDEGRFGAVLVDTTGVARAGTGVKAAGSYGFDSVVDSAAPMLPGFARAKRFTF